MVFTHKALWGLVAALAATSAGQGYYIYRQKTAAEAPRADTPREDEWFRRARKSLLEGAPLPLTEFDKLFDDEFFGRRLDPFEEMRRIERSFDSRLGGPERSLFGRSWDDWMSARLDLEDIKTSTRETGEEVVVELRIPGLAKGSADVDVNASRIRAAYEVREVRDEKDGRGALRGETVRRVEKVLPVPRNADGSRSEVTTEGETIKIVFPKKSP